MFLKPNTSPWSARATRSSTRSQTSSDVHYEGELAVVIGRICRDVPRGEGDRRDPRLHDRQRRDRPRPAALATGSSRAPRASTRSARSGRGSRPTWTRTTSARAVASRPFLNGDVVQDGTHGRPASSTSRQLIAHVSSVMTLLPGDVILTGTPEGVGPMERRRRDRGLDRRPRSPDQQGGKHAHDAPPALPVPRTDGPLTDGSARTSAWSARRSSTGPSPATTAAPSSSASRTRTRRATARRRYHQLLDALMRWLGIDWDEGVEVGGPHAPYRQSQRGDIYAGRHWPSSRPAATSTSPTPLRTKSRPATEPQAATPKLRATTASDRAPDATNRLAAVQGRGPRSWSCVFRMPDEDSITFNDLVRGEITFKSRLRPRLRSWSAPTAPLSTPW